MSETLPLPTTMNNPKAHLKRCLKVFKKHARDSEDGSALSPEQKLGLQYLHSHWNSREFEQVVRYRFLKHRSSESGVIDSIDALEQIYTDALYQGFALSSALLGGEYVDAVIALCPRTVQVSVYLENTDFNATDALNLHQLVDVTRLIEKRCVRAFVDGAEVAASSVTGSKSE